MSQTVFSGATGAPIDLDVHRRIRLRRLGLQGAVARVVADLVYGPARDAIALGVVADPGPLAGEARR